MIVTYQTKPCIQCHYPSSVAVDEDALRRWQSGTLVQDAFPHWTPEMRELLITGIHPECWDQMFGDDEE